MGTAGMASSAVLSMSAVDVEVHILFKSARQGAGQQKSRVDDVVIAADLYVFIIAGHEKLYYKES